MERDTIKKKSIPNVQSSAQHLRHIFPLDSASTTTALA